MGIPVKNKKFVLARHRAGAETPHRRFVYDV
jgi:hypothetical protein